MSKTFSGSQVRALLLSLEYLNHAESPDGIQEKYRQKETQSLEQKVTVGDERETSECMY
jgi:hypothetical protein